MNPQNKYFVFSIEKRRYAVALLAVKKVIRAVQLIDFPEAPEYLLGLLNMHGDILPVLNIRKQFHLPHRELQLDDQIIICETSSRSIAFVVDEAIGVVEFSQDLTDKTRSPFPEKEHYIEGLGNLNDDAILICNIERLLHPLHKATGSFDFAQ